MSGGAGLPRWAERARSLVRVAVTVWAVLVLSGLALRLIGLLLDTDVLSDGFRTAGTAVWGVTVAVIVGAGLVWLAGEVLTGFREPREDGGAS